MTALKLPPPVRVHGTEPGSTRAPKSVTCIGIGPSADADARETANASAANRAHSPHAQAGRGESPAPAQGKAPGHVQAVARQGDSPLFRHEALRAYRMGARLSAPLRVVPLSTGIVLGTVCAALVVALTIASLGRIDLVARGRGTIRPTEGVQPLRFEVEGIVRDVLVREGEVVRAGQVLLRLDSTRLQATLREAEEQLRSLREHVQREDKRARRSFARDEALLQLREKLTRERIDSQKATIAAQEEERARYSALAEDGLVAEKVLREGEVLAHQEGRTLILLQDELARIEQQRSTLEQSVHAGITQRARDLRETENRRDTARLLLKQTELTAVRTGRLESLVVNEGDVIEAGKVVARLVPLTRGREVTAFMPERERAFVTAGKEVRVEFDQLPVGEFGSARARVLRVSSEVASAQELERALGAAAPQGVHFGVALQMLDDPDTNALLAKVGSGTLLTVRVSVRSRRIISLVFDPVRKWLD